ncbi:MAG TPA: hypothetical protein VFK10_17190 [Burkholderiaceae bacterium]|nr:hypothetical protein [Burkholderiaceae bacterium]
MGIALDSCARVIALLDRPVAASALGVWFARSTTESAAGTVVPSTGDRFAASGSTLIASTSGTVGPVGPLSQAFSNSAEKQSATKVDG